MLTEIKNTEKTQKKHRKNQGTKVKVVAAQRSVDSHWQIVAAGGKDIARFD